MQTRSHGWMRWGAWLGPAFLTTALAGAELETLRGHWRTPQGDVLEFRSRGDEWRAFLREAAPEGLGRFFAPDAPVLFDITRRDGAIVCALRPGTAANQAIDLTARQADYTAIGGPLELAWSEDANAITLQIQPTLERHFFDQDNWLIRVEKLPEVLPPLVVTLARARSEPGLQIFLVRGEQREPAAVFYHNVEYVAEYVTADLALPRTIDLTFAVGARRVVVAAEAVSEGRERRYRSRPFVLRVADEGLPLPP